MKLVTLSSKNQITLPKSLLQQLGVKSKSKLLIEAKEDSLVVKPVRQSIVDATAGSLNKYISPDKLGKSLEEIMEETRKLVVKDLAAKYEKSAS